MTIQVGDRLPDVPLTIAGADGPKPTTSGEFFAKRSTSVTGMPYSQCSECGASCIDRL